MTSMIGQGKVHFTGMYFITFGVIDVIGVIQLLPMFYPWNTMVKDLPYFLPGL